MFFVFVALACLAVEIFIMDAFADHIANQVLTSIYNADATTFFNKY